MNCPCGQARDYAECCGRYHAGAVAPSPETLMRSRYSAYVLKDETYLLATWHTSTRPASLNLADDPAKWVGLEIRKTDHSPACLAPDNLQKNGVGAAHGTVEFIARYKTGGRALRLHETSRFVLEHDSWFYVEGDLHETKK